VWERVEYYTRPNGRQPAAEWIDDQDNSIRPSIDTRINRLDKEGLSLSKEMLGPIKGEDSNLYELKHKGKKWRIATYYNYKRDVFILLCGWRKTQQKQPRDIARARRLLHEYLD
jgi:putative component of toxin-antitoxin plasmid stabilization module